MEFNAASSSARISSDGSASDAFLLLDGGLIASCIRNNTLVSNALWHLPAPDTDCFALGVDNHLGNCRFLR
jgi:hypothetical protein